MNTRQKWTDAEVAFLHEHYLNLCNSDIGKILNRTSSSIDHKLGKLGLRRPATFAAEIRNGRKLKRIRNTPSSSWFKKGNKSARGLYNGAIRTRTHEGKTYHIIRLEANKWKSLKIYLWEAEHGPIPKGHVVRFKDGNTLNCQIDNLYLVSRAEHMRLNRNPAKSAQTAKQIRATQPKAQLFQMAGRNRELARFMAANAPELLALANLKTELSHAIQNLD